MNQPKPRLFVPDHSQPEIALRRTTHLGIGAHQDDLEFMAFHGILACYHSQEKWFTGITCTDGAGSSRTGPYAHYTDEDMKAIRVQEQEIAATSGHYSAMIQLGLSSTVAKDPGNPLLKDMLRQFIGDIRPEFVYTHNPADKHDTHIGVVVATLQAIRELPKEVRPKTVWGCECWRDLDWLPDEDKVLHDVSAHGNLAAALNGVFDSQIAGGKRYDLAVQGRRRANATFFASHASDNAEMLGYAMDLTPLAQDDSLDIVEYTIGFIRKFENDVRGKLSHRLGHSA